MQRSGRRGGGGGGGGNKFFHSCHLLLGCAGQTLSITDEDFGLHDFTPRSSSFSSFQDSRSFMVDCSIPTYYQTSGVRTKAMNLVLCTNSKSASYSVFCLRNT